MLTAAALLALLASCGDSRRDVKMMADGQAIAVERIPFWTSIDELAGLPSPDPPVEGSEGRGIAPNDPDHEIKAPFSSPEFQVFSISGTVFLAKLQEDGDIRLGLRGDTSRMVVAIIDPRCASPSYALDEVREVRKAVRRLLRWRPLTDAALYQAFVGRRVRMEGPAFLDRKHRDTAGAAPSGIELHPVLRLEVLQ